MASLLDTAALAWIAVAILLFPVQLFVTAPYGRHARTDWGRRSPTGSAGS